MEKLGIENKNRQFHVRYLCSPKKFSESPVTLLVPHYLSQVDNKSM